MAMNRDQFIKECEFARLILRNTIANKSQPDLAEKARKILNDPQLFEKFVMNRIERKAAARASTETEQKVKIQAFGRVMSWLSFKR